MIQMDSKLAQNAKIKNGLSPAQILRQVPLKTASGRSVLTQFSPVLRVDCRKEVAMRDLNDAYTEY